MRHLIIDRFHEPRGYKSHARPHRAKVPLRPDPAAHGMHLSAQVGNIKQDYKTLAETWERQEAVKARGIVIEIEGFPGGELHTEQLLSHGLVLLNHKETQNQQKQPVEKESWFVPDGKLTIIDQFLNDYLTKTRKVKGGKIQAQYRNFAESVKEIGTAAAKELWTEHDSPFPEAETLWFEVWLRAGNSKLERAVILEQFRTLARKEGLTVGAGTIELPEHTVVACNGLGSQLAGNLALLNCIAEIRRGRDYADFFDSLNIPDQAGFVQDLNNRIDLPPDHAPYITILDTGINRGHPALESLIAESDNHTIRQDWGAGDDDDHGTVIAGICAFGNLSGILGSNERIKVPVRMEGVKIVPPEAQRSSDEKLAGYYTAQGVARAEIAAPDRKRLWCITTTMVGPNDPRPTSWSSALDSLAAGSDNGHQTRRLFCLSAGNVLQDKWTNYPTANLEQDVQNPSQSWNALCVGSYTDLDLIQLKNKEYSPIAFRGCMAPTNSCSTNWDNVWPNKPDVVFEGGNAGLQAANNSSLQLAELMLLSTASDYRKGALVTCCGTSPAAALASNMAGRIAAEYPDFWPETVRGLIVHSASWTDAMQSSVPKELKGADRVRHLLRTVGYGVPNLAKALESAKSRATLIAQCEIQPFKTDGKEVLFNHLHLHSLPWPDKELASHKAETVRLRVTLSYFVDPNPGNRGYTSTFRYCGCQLRFRVSSEGQTAADLEAQVSKLAADDMQKQHGHGYTKGSPEGWSIGQQAFRGSIHSDVWEGSAASLLSRKYIAVYPVAGWWRTRPSQRKATATQKYSLVVTIESANPEVDVFTEIQTLIQTPIELPGT